jgi:hypothetical protein
MSKRLSIRVSEFQYAALAAKAGRKTVSQYVREQLELEAKSRTQEVRKPRHDEVLLARILMALGSSDMAASMRDIADAARNGALPESPDVLLSLQAACLTIQKMRVDLVQALGIKPDGCSP